MGAKPKSKPKKRKPPRAHNGEPQLEAPDLDADSDQEPDSTCYEGLAALSCGTPLPTPRMLANADADLVVAALQQASAQGLARQTAQKQLTRLIEELEVEREKTRDAEERASSAERDVKAAKPILRAAGIEVDEF